MVMRFESVSERRISGDDVKSIVYLRADQRVIGVKKAMSGDENERLEFN